MKNRLIVLCLLLSATAVAQQPQPEIPDTAYDHIPNMSPEDYINLKLPPLHTLLENARTAPQMLFYESNVEISQSDLKTARREWMTYLKLNASYNYGSSDIYSQTHIENGQPVINNSGSNRNWWNIGAGLSIPLEGIFNRRNKIRQRKQHIEQTEYERDRSFDELRIRIVQVYTVAIEQITSLRSVTEARTMAQAQYAVAENDFLNGKIDYQSLGTQKNIETSAIRTFEEVKRNLTSALLQLEVFTNTPIISRPETSPTTELEKSE